jgi:hypothetical protein
MQQQPLLTTGEVLELLKQVLPDGDEDLRNAYNELNENFTLIVTYSSKPINIAIFRLLQLGANLLRSRGIFVYFDYYKPETQSRYFRFVVGECGRVYARLKKQYDYLYDLCIFIEDNEDELPKTMVAKKKKIEDYMWMIRGKYMWQLGEAYRQGYKEGLKELCEEAWKFADEIDEFLESIKNLRRLHAISSIL